MYRFFSWALLLIPMVCNATDFKGKINNIRYGTSLTRVSIYVGEHTSPCADRSSYAFQDTSGLWSAAFLQALNAGRNVYIHGTGTCDSFGVEVLQYFSVY